MAWTLTTSLAALRRDLNAAFPNRDKASDGTIGDAAHAVSVSGHNPDDTSGSRAEYTDADNKAEVRAFDADNDLRDPRGIDFQQVIDAILRAPADRDRLAYIIHRRKIWRKRNGWRQETYTGDSPHDEHAHFSGDPIHDENGAAWTSILAFREDDMSVHSDGVIEAWRTGSPTAADGAEVEPVKWRIRDEAWQKSVDDKLAALSRPMLSDDQLPALAKLVAAELRELRFVPEVPAP